MIITGKFARTLSLDSLKRAVKSFEDGDAKQFCFNVLTAFDWSLAPEGFEYWKKVWGAARYEGPMDKTAYARLKVYRDLANRGKAAA
jgi:hypothetical protein